MTNKIAVNQKMLLSIEEVAQLTSSSVSWWRGAIRGDKPLPPGIVPLRLGRCWKISRESLEKWIAAGAPAPAPARRRPGRPRKGER